MADKNKFFKVCGITEPQSAKNLDDSRIKYLGFIFYSPSKRNALDVNPSEINGISDKFKSVGVFVDTDVKDIVSTCKACGINVVQLHGQEKPSMCSELIDQGLTVIKAIPIGPVTSYKSNIKLYDGIVDYILFDSSGVLKGGNGTKFDWRLLENLDINVPFILSGGIGPLDESTILWSVKSFGDSLAGWDLNSLFETAPGIKDISLINNFVRKFEL